MDYFPTFTAFFRSLKQLPQRFPRLSSGRLLRFDASMLFRQLASMLHSGVPLPQALAFLTDEFSAKVGRKIEAVRSRVEQGEPLSAALEELPNAWVSGAWRTAVAAGERSGRLPEVLDQLAEEGERLQEIGRKLRSVLVYPLSVLLFAGLIVSVIMWKTIPVLAALYRSLGAALPFGTVLIEQSWDYLRVPYFALVLLLLAHIVARTLMPNARLPLSWLGEMITPSLPIARGLRQSAIEVRFARTLRLLLDAGLALPEALDLCEGVVSDTKAGRQIGAAARRIRGGELPSHALGEVDAVAPAFLWFLAGSEQRGDFLDVTAAMAQAAEERFATRVDLAERVLEPASIVTIGVIIGFAVVHFYWPMFRLIGVVGNN
jgi:type II secretory pathway component PulF